MKEALVLMRHTFAPEYTLGTLYAPPHGILCMTLEDRDKELDAGDEREHIEAAKVAGKTAIPTGLYEVILNRSPKFRRVLPRLLDVPAFSGILIHPGNWPRDTEGCILTGTSVGAGRTFASFAAHLRVMAYLRDQLKSSRCAIRIARQDAKHLQRSPSSQRVVFQGGLEIEAWA